MQIHEVKSKCLEYSKMKLSHTKRLLKQLCNSYVWMNLHHIPINNYNDNNKDSDNNNNTHKYTSLTGTDYCNSTLSKMYSMKKAAT